MLAMEPSTSKQTYTPPPTPTTAPPPALALTLATEITSIHTTLLTLPSLAPSPPTNTLLTRLVHLCTQPYPQTLITAFFAQPGIHQTCTSLRALCSRAESALEMHYAKGMLEADTAVLERFPYYGNYCALSRLERGVVGPFLRKKLEKVVFVGSGPLPLSSFCLVDAVPGVRVHNVDRDCEAVRTSAALAGKLGYGGMTFACVDVGSGDDAERWEDFDVVFLAALVGADTQEKRGLLARLSKRLRVGSLVVARSAKGLRAVLYPVLELGGEFAEIGLELLVEVHPWTEVVNSVIVFRVMER